MSLPVLEMQKWGCRRRGNDILSRVVGKYHASLCSALLLYAAFGYASQHLTSTYSILPRASFAASGYSATHLVSLRRISFASHQLSSFRSSLLHFAASCFASQHLALFAASCFTSPQLASFRSILLYFVAAFVISQ